MKRWAFLLALMIVAPIFGATFSSEPVKGNGFAVLYFTGETIPTSSFIEKRVYGVAGYRSLTFKATPSAGSITTANVVWEIPYQGSAVTFNSVTLDESTVTEDFRTDVVRIRLYNYQEAPVTVTGSILFRGNY